MTYSTINIVDAAAQCEEAGRSWQTDALAARWPCNPELGPRWCCPAVAATERKLLLSIKTKVGIKTVGWRSQIWKKYQTVTVAFIPLKRFRLVSWLSGPLRHQVQEDTFPLQGVSDLPFQFLKAVSRQVVKLLYRLQGWIISKVGNCPGAPELQSPESSLPHYLILEPLSWRGSPLF